MNLVVLLGPTGIGKTELALNLADYLDSPILNCDSRQIYKHLQIGTAAPTPEQLERVQHFFVHDLELEEQYSAARYEEDVLRLLPTLATNHNTILLSGGSMMYIDAVCNGIDDIPTIAPDVRENLMNRYATEGLDTLRKELRLIDPEYYSTIDLKNPKRIIHALEVYYTSGKTYSSFRTNTKKSRNFNIIKIGLQREREDLFSRINSRVDTMIKQGLVQEAESFLGMKHLNSLNTVGYKEIFKFLENEWTLDFAIEKIKKNTRDYAKKQMTWFRRDTSTQWFLPEDSNGIKAYLEHRIIW